MNESILRDFHLVGGTALALHLVRRALKSLVYFEDADLEPDPIAIIPVDWNTVKVTIRSHIKEYL